MTMRFSIALVAVVGLTARSAKADTRPAVHADERANSYMSLSLGYGVGGFENGLQSHHGPGAWVRGGYFFSDHFGIGALAGFSHFQRDSNLNLQNRGTSTNSVVAAQVSVRFWRVVLGPFVGVDAYRGSAQPDAEDSFTDLAYGWQFSWSGRVSPKLRVGVEVIFNAVIPHEPSFALGHLGALAHYEF